MPVAASGATPCGARQMLTEQGELLHGFSVDSRLVSTAASTKRLTPGLLLMVSCARPRNVPSSKTRGVNSNARHKPVSQLHRLRTERQARAGLCRWMPQSQLAVARSSPMSAS